MEQVPLKDPARKDFNIGESMLLVCNIEDLNVLSGTSGGYSLMFYGGGSCSFQYFVVILRARFLDSTNCCTPRLEEFFIHLSVSLKSV